MRINLNLQNSLNPFQFGLPFPQASIKDITTELNDPRCKITALDLSRNSLANAADEDFVALAKFAQNQKHTLRTDISLSARITKEFKSSAAAASSSEAHTPSAAPSHSAAVDADEPPTATKPK